MSAQRARERRRSADLRRNTREWDRMFARKPQTLQRMIAQAKADIAAGRVMSVDDMIARCERNTQIPPRP